MRRHSLAAAMAFVVSMLAATGAAQAIVVDPSLARTGVSTVQYPQDLGNYVGVRLTPQTDPATALAAPPNGAGIPIVNSTGCSDPAKTSDIFLPALTSLCWQGGTVLHRNETFAFVWDPSPFSDFAAPYEEQFLRDVADGSGSFTSPYSVTTQYSDAPPATPYNPMDLSHIDRSHEAGNTSVYGGGYDETSGYIGPTCDYTQPPASPYPNARCVTDQGIKQKLVSVLNQQGLWGRLQPGYDPVIVVLLPPGVETCIDASSYLCSANSSGNVASTSVPVTQFCSYHSQVTDQTGKVYEYVVQPWTARWDSGAGIATGCDEPDVPTIPPSFTAQQLRSYMGARLVGPLSESHLAAIVNPAFTGWFSPNGDEINDNTCAPQKNLLDQVVVGSSGQNPYYLQREFNNGGSITVDDPFAPACAPGVTLAPHFVVPSAVNQGDVVEFDGAKADSALLVPMAQYGWNFGDGTTAVGPSAIHSYSKGGAYTVTLNVIDRGGNTATASETITVLGPTGKVVTPPGGSTTIPALKARFQLWPQALKTMLRLGLQITVSCNQSANGIVTMAIPRSAAKRAHIKAGRGPSIVIGRGTVAGVKSGTTKLRLRLSRATAKKLTKLRHVTVTVRLSLIAAGGRHISIVAAGRY